MGKVTIKLGLFVQHEMHFFSKYVSVWNLFIYFRFKLMYVWLQFERIDYLKKEIVSDNKLWMCRKDEDQGGEKNGP